MTKQVEIFEINYSCSPGGVDCWAVNIQEYGSSRYSEDWDTAGQALDWAISQYPNEELEVIVTTLSSFEKMSALDDMLVSTSTEEN